MKLTKAQKVFFTDFTKNAVQNLLVAQTKPEYAEQVTAAAQEVLATADLSTLAEAIGVQFLTLVDFKTIVKVDKFLKTEDYVKTAAASTVVLSLVAENLGVALRDVAEAIEAKVGQAEA